MSEIDATSKAEEFLANKIMESGEIDLDDLHEAIKLKKKNIRIMKQRKLALDYYYKNRDEINKRRRERDAIRRAQKKAEKLAKLKLEEESKQ